MDEIVLSKKVNKHVPKDKWIASLSNGETIFDDHREGLPPAWERLGQYVRSNGLSITNLRLQIGGLEVDLPSNMDAYIQKKKVQSTGTWTKFNICIGYAQGGKAMIHELGSDRSSCTKMCDDPGEPWTIYNSTEL